ncbi:PRD domain-containing protein [Neobacillus drentensis]|uniref:family 4 glycosyl hydrolase n=1 Tax=Neobacillus drentensis TaxID=220684 RepID=UPI002FFF9684
MLNSRTIAILRELIAVDTPITSEYLANVIQVTSRTIRNDIKELETFISKYGASIKSIRGAGYKLKIDDDKVFRKFLLEEFQSEKLKPSMLPNTPEERVHYLMKRLVLTENFLKLEDLADELFISKSTVQNDLKDVKKILQTYDLSFEVKPNYGLKVKGEEVKLRFCMSEYVFNRIQTEYDLHSSQKPLIPIDEMKMIRGIILEQIKENEITLSDIGLNNLIIHIAIACKRIIDGNYVILNNEELKDVTNQKEYGVANKIVREIENRMKVDFLETEIAYVAIHLLGTRMIRHLNNKDGDLRNYIDKDIYRLTMEILDSIETELTLGPIDEQELIVAIGLHLKPAISRYDKRDIQQVNTRNNGAIASIPDDSAVEVNCMITKDGPKPIAVGDMPVAVRGLVQQIKSFERISAEAAVTGDYKTALLAMTINPLVPSDRIAKQILDEMLEAHKEYLPQIFIKQKSEV